MKTFRVVELFTGTEWAVEHYTAQDAVYHVVIDLMKLPYSDFTESNGKYTFSLNHKVEDRICYTTTWKGY